MAEALKNMFSREYLQGVAADMKTAYPPFLADDFVDSVMDENWDNLELKGRMRQITLNLGKFLLQDYPEAIKILDKAVASQGSWLEGFAMFFPDFVEVYGQDEAHWDISIAALARYTRHASAEFAVRPFIINHEERMMAQMMAWSKSDCEHERRLASEGCRPALPWAQALPRFKKDPSPVLPILEELKQDPAKYVQKSVANNLNDISKTHPELVVQIAKNWYGDNEITDWIVKHACRTLLKRANRDVLAIFGFGSGDDVDAKNFAIDSETLAKGDILGFSFEVTPKKTGKVRMEYAIDFVKANGKQSRKIFQISEIGMNSGQTKNYSKSHSFADLSTRKHYAGLHKIALIVNGQEQGSLEFELLERTE